MSTHRDCGEPIKWARRDDDSERFMPPLEYVGEVYVIDSGGAAIMVHAYRQHRCDPDKMEAWQEYLGKMDKLKGTTVLADMTAHEAARERDREARWEVALRKECIRCDAPAGERCRDMSARYRKTGEIVHTNNPHPERLEGDAQ